MKKLCILFVFIGCLCFSSIGFAQNHEPIFPQIPGVGAVDFVNSDGAGTANSKVLVTGATNGTRVFFITAVTDSSANETISLYMVDSESNKYKIGEVLINDLSGTNGSTDPAVNLLDSTFLDWLPVDGAIVIPNNWYLHVAPKTAVTDGTGDQYTVTIVAFTGEY